jgi:ADP-ribose pyrophosphatase YjhB (NUDIX family)
MPEATVAAIITRGDDATRVLLTRRNGQPFRGLWCLPGGHIDRFERARDAVIRRTSSLSRALLGAALHVRAVARPEAR